MVLAGGIGIRLLPRDRGRGRRVREKPGTKTHAAPDRTTQNPGRLRSRWRAFRLRHGTAAGSRISKNRPCSLVFGGKEYLNDPGVTGGTHTYLCVRYFLLAPGSRSRYHRSLTWDPPTWNSFRTFSAMRQGKKPPLGKTVKMRALAEVSRCGETSAEWAK